MTLELLKETEGHILMAIGCLDIRDKQTETIMSLALDCYKELKTEIKMQESILELKMEVN